MATTVDDDDFDLPELTDEILAEFKPPLTELAHTDLHMGAAQVKPLKPAVAAPFDIANIVWQAVIGVGYVAVAWLFVKVWIWALTS